MVRERFHVVIEARDQIWKDCDIAANRPPPKFGPDELPHCDPDNGRNYPKICRNEPSTYHGCPYKEDIDDDHEHRCTCCEDCQDECAWDI